MTDAELGDKPELPLTERRLEEVATWLSAFLAKDIEWEPNREMFEDALGAVEELQRRRKPAGNRPNVDVLHVDGQYTPQQLLVALQDVIDNIGDLVVMIGWEEHPTDGGQGWQLAMTTTPRALAYFALGIGMDKIMGQARAAKRIERDEDLEPLGD